MQAMALEAVFGHTVFYIPDSLNSINLLPYVETYWEIDPHTVHFTSTPEKTIIARIKTDIYFSNASGIVSQDHFILKTPPKTNVNELSSLSIIDLRRYFLSKGSYTVKLMLTDLGDSSQKFTYTDTFSINPGNDSVFYSNPQLLDTVIESPKPTFYFKNGHQQIPVCLNFLDEPKKVLHYYAELYGAGRLSKSNFPLYQRITINKKETDVQGNLFKTDTLLSAVDLMPITGSFNISGLASGNYNVHVTLENKFHYVLASGNLFFQRLNKHPAVDSVKRAAARQDTGMENVTVLNLNKTFVAKYSLSEVKAILKMLLPFTDPTGTQAINGFLRSPDELYMRYFIYNFFTSVNKDDPGKAWKEFTEKIIEVNKLYSATGLRGYETDRGFIYLRYGPPTDVITVENEQGTLPYEIWQYNILTEQSKRDVTDAVFLFYKPNQNTSDFKILHSTVTGETQNLAWRSFLYLNASGGNNTNSRAEQYLGSR
jgi:GWxTD domain-containing protein